MGKLGSLRERCKQSDLAALRTAKQWDLQAKLEEKMSFDEVQGKFIRQHRSIHHMPFLTQKSGYRGPRSNPLDANVSVLPPPPSHHIRHMTKKCNQHPDRYDEYPHMKAPTS